MAAVKVGEVDRGSEEPGAVHKEAPNGRLFQPCDVTLVVVTVFSVVNTRVWIVLENCVGGSGGNCFARYFG